MRARFDHSDSLYDVAVIGGGIIGAGIARDASLRGLRVALIEKHDFGSGTTSASTRLAHGGLRYLETADIRLVRLDLRERELLLRNAPHLVKPLEFLLPFFRGRGLERLKLRAGMFLYDALSFDKSLPSHRIIGERELRAFEPSVASSRVNGGAVYFDAQIHSPERLTIENVVGAVERGASAWNYAEVTGVLREQGRIAGVHVRDLLDGSEADIRARLVVNASGPWFDAVAARIHAGDRAHGQAAGGSGSPRVRTTKGIHVACEPFTAHAIALPSAVDGRLVFAIPWSGYTWLGTTDTDFSGDPGSVCATEEEVEYLVRSVERVLPAASHARRYWTCAGVRALARAPGSASRVSRMHRVVADEPGLVSVIGGKITGYRAIAEEAADVVCSTLGSAGACVTRSTPLPGGGAGGTGAPHLDAIYGSRAREVAALSEAEPALAARLDPRYAVTAAEVVFSVRQECCRRLEDFMLRRSYLGFEHDRGVEAADPASRWMQRELGWTEPQRVHEVDAYCRRVREDCRYGG